MRERRFTVVIPAQGFDRGKTRLASVLSPAERRRLSRRWFRHVVVTARRVAGDVLVVSRAAEVLGLARRMGARTTCESGQGLNQAAHQGADAVKRDGGRLVVVAHADLPELSAGELRALFHALAKHRGVALAPDRDRDGTNLLALRGAATFRFRYGAGSFLRHLAEARRRRVRTRVLTLPGASRDIDAPAQLDALATPLKS